MNAQELKVRYGMVKAKIGTRHNMRCPDGKVRMFTVKDKSRYLNLPMKCICFLCKESFDSEEQLIAAHQPKSVLVKQQESHLYMWWCDVPMPREEEATVEPVEEDKKKPKAPKPTDWARVHGMFSDEEMVEE